MNEQAAHLVDRVLPNAPYRQWVLTLPGELARVVAFDDDLATAVFGVFADELARWQRGRANDLGIADPQTGSLLEIQRFADGARLYPHAHAVVPDGVFVASSDDHSARFIRQDPPSDEDVAYVVSRVEHRLTRVLARWRAWRQPDSAHDSEDTDILPACAEVRPTEFVRLSSQQESQDRRPSLKKPLCARSPGGLELHAEVTIASHDRKGLERLCRYLSRPPIPQLSAGRGGASSRAAATASTCCRSSAPGREVSRRSCSSPSTSSPVSPRSCPHPTWRCGDSMASSHRTIIFVR